MLPSNFTQYAQADLAHGTTWFLGGMKPFHSSVSPGVCWYFWREGFPTTTHTHLHTLILGGSLPGQDAVWGRKLGVSLDGMASSTGIPVQSRGLEKPVPSFTWGARLHGEQHMGLDMMVG